MLFLGELLAESYQERQFAIHLTNRLTGKVALILCGFHNIMHGFKLEKFEFQIGEIQCF